MSTQNVRYQVTAPAFGIVKDAFLTRYAASKFARQWEREGNWGRGVAAVSSYPIVDDDDESDDQLDSFQAFEDAKKAILGIGGDVSHDS